MSHLRVFRQGKGTFCEWALDNDRSAGRIMNQGTGIFLENAFLSVDEARAFCETEPDKDASLVFYVVQGENIIDYIRNDAYHDSIGAKQNRLFVAVTAAIVMLLASVVTFIIMPFQLVLYDMLFIVAMVALYLMIYSIGGRMNMEAVVLMIIILILLSIMVPMPAR